MRKIALMLPLALLIGACGGPQTPTVATVDLTGPTTLTIGNSATLNTSVKDSSGKVLTTTVTFTSSAPNIVAVDGSGKLAVNRLTAPGTPVTLTATAGGKSDTLQVTTYGLELALGTENGADLSSPGLLAVTRFRPPSGQTSDSLVTVQSPAGYQVKCWLYANYTQDYCYNFMTDPAKYPNGTYTASTTHNGITYATTATISSRSSLLPLPLNVNVTNSGRLVTWTASNVGGAAVYVGSLESTNDYASYYRTVLPISGTIPSDVPAGLYLSSVDAFSFNFFDSTQVLPTNVNNSFAYGPDITLP